MWKSSLKCASIDFYLFLLYRWPQENLSLKAALLRTAPSAGKNAGNTGLQRSLLQQAAFRIEARMVGSFAEPRSSKKAGPCYSLNSPAIGQYVIHGDCSHYSRLPKIYQCLGNT